MKANPHILVNGLSIGGGGGYTVGRELFRHIALHRPGWKVTLAVVRDHPLHSGFRSETFPSNAEILWAPPETAAPLPRTRYENRHFPEWARANGVTAVLQLNGMIVPGMPAPTLSHCQDPWPYRPEAWISFKERVVAFLKRRRNARAFREAAIVGFTSVYLKDLLISRLGIVPKRAEVYYNGLPEDMLERARRPFPDWASRPLEIVTVSNVHPYKRQELVVRAMAELVKRPGLEGLRYRIVGQAGAETEAGLRALIASLGLGEHVTLEGRVSDERVQAFLARARAFVLMSVCESFGIPAIEAMSFGTPVVTADCCAMPEVCGDAAILSPVDDVRALADNIERVLKSPETAEALRAEGARQAGRFAWSDTAARMADHLEEIM